jgi:diadenylate cyclase
MVVIVSEENRSVGIVQGGVLTPMMDMGDLRQRLYELYGLKFKASSEVFS